MPRKYDAESKAKAVPNDPPPRVDRTDGRIRVLARVVWAS
jgi:hypothetical protein